MPLGTGKRGGGDRQRMARYLGAQTSLRFNVRHLPYARYRQWRTRLAIAATLFLLIGLWGVWREFWG